MKKSLYIYNKVVIRLVMGLLPFYLFTYLPFYLQRLLPRSRSN